MRLEFVDADNALKSLNVGDIFNIDAFRNAIDFDLPLDNDISELDCKIDGVYIDLIRKSTSHVIIEWSVVCQDVFLVVDADTKRVLYTSKDYSRYDRINTNCPFYEDFKKAFESIFENDDKLFQAPDADDFEDI